ncbi:site-specific DNA-methyltransferase [Mesorhizobium sp. B2-7-1]|uniref:site-specific DNA-methyltransferase n=1 Tax=Mesorhizobium sp. B2-7-1 TaxID=2589909 RepID=UPI00112CBDC3|nr:site-specific DNA-methyltransferase [Mesorhizobium sp. B2-7-1]TPJ53576.1 site-specific DNA-methyltransferase [Mesorhizobium sp. B2-7-1]
MNKTIHPFPARMAPELALLSLQTLKPNSVVLDPMVGSGTVLRQATDLGLQGIGFDVDPLAVLIAGVWTTPVDLAKLDSLFERTLREAKALVDEEILLPWIDNDQETARFIEYWFGIEQRKALRAIAYVFRSIDQEKDDAYEQAELDVLRVSLSRIIITKEMCASLARDTSHSRPHKVSESSDYNVFAGFDRSFRILRKRLHDFPPKRKATVQMGDARTLTSVNDSSIDAVLTSPPYLNAIDYLRGHRLALVWFGLTCSEIRTIRAGSIGTERGLQISAEDDAFVKIKKAAGDVSALPSSYDRMIDRYVVDLIGMTAETARVLRAGAVATFVVGNSCLKGVFISNANSVATAATYSGLKEVKRFDRELPTRSRYLPLSNGALSKRMRTETILSFIKE